jgi:hypothetical protein
MYINSERMVTSSTSLTLNTVSSAIVLNKNDAEHKESIGRPPFTYFQHAKTYLLTTIIDLL